MVLVLTVSVCFQSFGDVQGVLRVGDEDLARMPAVPDENRAGEAHPDFQDLNRRNPYVNRMIYLRPQLFSIVIPT